MLDNAKISSIKSEKIKLIKKGAAIIKTGYVPPSGLYLTQVASKKLTFFKQWQLFLNF